MSYTLQSRGIGAGQSLAVTPVDFAGGGATRLDLAPRELAYYKVTIPAGQTSWQVKLTATTGDVALVVGKGALPHVFGSMVVRKLGNDHYVLLPTYATNNGQTETTLPAGDYYLAVVSQGANERGDRWQSHWHGQRRLHPAEPGCRADRRARQRGGGGAPTWSGRARRWRAAR